MVSLQCTTYMHGVAAAIRICCKALGLGGLFRPQVGGLHMQQKILFSYKEPCLVYLENICGQSTFPSRCSYQLQ